MFKIRKAAVFLLIGFLCISLAGCGRSRSSYRSKNQLKYETVAKNLLKALDGKDADGIEALFSPFAKEQDPELKEKVERLTKFLEGPVQAADLDERGFPAARGCGLLVPAAGNRRADRHDGERRRQ